MPLPVEAFDTRGYVGTLTYYPTCPRCPALLVNHVSLGGEYVTLSTNLEEYGWYADGLQIAVKQYESAYLKTANALVALGILKPTSQAIPGPFRKDAWRVYDLVPEALKPGVAEAWTEHLADLATAPAEAIPPKTDAPDHSPENLRRLTRIHIKRYEDRRGWGNANPAELSRLVAVWMGVEAENYVYENLSDEAKAEISDAIAGGE